MNEACLVFPFSRDNANAISALLASLDIHPQLNKLAVFLPSLNQGISSLNEGALEFKKIILAFSVYSTQLDQVSHQIDQYRDLFKNKKLLVFAGGPHPIGDPFSMLYNGADIVCTGEGEITFTDVLARYISDQSLLDIKGIAILTHNKRLIKNPKSDFVDLNSFPSFSFKRGLIRPIEITRGCAWKCRFCQIRSKGIPVKHRSVSEILKYVDFTVKHFSQRRADIRFISPNALSYGSQDGKSLNLKIIEELLSGIRKLIGAEGKIYFGSFPSELRPETITPESAKLLKKYTNVSKLILGGQSGSDRVLELSDRGHDVAETERAVALLIKEGFEVDVDIIFGLPGEEDEDVKQTISHMEKLVKLGARIHSHTFLPLVGTPFASSKPGKINSQYLQLISEFQGYRLLSGQHEKQQEEAKLLASRRSEEKEIRRSYS
ncbi:MAG: TIGR04013 family B12-binding domain/radical SAM domain-containing protein [Candidatus Heimdallarchaeota archaeon]|nr:TIGR04013 family B12-binding domain/radical SAM domain-containing protein [Candidatus Heimdallarchaeota archaeon]